ncbi:diguanylate cyclase [Dinoroseobacter sp. S124A]|uniref:diguanylate cyclase n=1 Tax=Dinoroseobacter sp. S124A TaxID=3415128 RepID=UPI003C7AA4FE
MSGKILVVDDVATNRIVMKVKLATACYDVIQADSGRAALDMARAETPDLILLDVLMPDLDGFTVCERLKADPRTADIPIIMITSLDDTEARLRGLSCGADEFLSKPVTELTLLARVRSLLRANSRNAELRMPMQSQAAAGFADAPMPFKQAQTECVGLLMAQDGVGHRWAHGLADRIREDVKFFTRAQALEASKDQAAVFVIEADAHRPEAALEILTDLRSRPATRHAQQIFMLQQSHPELAARALDLGADDVVIAPISVQEMALRLRAQLQHKRTSDRRRNEVTDRLRQAVIDPLTGLYNRRFALGQLATIAREAEGSTRSFAVLLLDFDHFKQINDKFGHAAGDKVLTDTAKLLQARLRSLDVIARIGGEEFLMVLPDTDLDEAQRVAERLRAGIDQAKITLPDGVTRVPVTISIGLAIGGHRTPDASVSDLLETADRALYAAKSDGRNQVSVGTISSAA